MTAAAMDVDAMVDEVMPWWLRVVWQRRFVVDFYGAWYIVLLKRRSTLPACLKHLL